MPAKKKQRSNKEIALRQKMAEERRAWHRQYKKDLLAKTTLQQRRAFIEALHEQLNFGEAMKAADIDCVATAVLIYNKNSRKHTYRTLVDVEKVR